MLLIFLALAAVFVAYANGANDDFKGVATLYGGKVLSYRLALGWALFTTLAGSIASYFLAGKLLQLFSGKGIVIASVLWEPTFLISVALGAAITVMVATILGFPISTTHSLVGALTGAGIASHGLLSLTALGKAFFLPLILGPVVAVLLTGVLYSLAHWIRKRTGIESNFCLCVGNQQQVLVGIPGLYTIRSSGLRVAVEEEQYCRAVYSGRVFGINIQKMMDGFHVLTGGAVSFARGLNDAPKIAALLLLVPFLSPRIGLPCIGMVMMIGGLLHSRKIAQRMSFDITAMNPGQAFTGNFVTAALVIAASVAGLPLSTTHVSCGAIFGIGVVNRQARVRTVLQILLAWITTLPLAAILAAFIWFILGR